MSDGSRSRANGPEFDVNKFHFCYEDKIAQNVCFKRKQCEMRLVKICNEFVVESKAHARVW